MPWTVWLLQATGVPQHVLVAGQPPEKKGRLIRR